jgi:hypothetical protein
MLRRSSKTPDGENSIRTRRGDKQVKRRLPTTIMGEVIVIFSLEKKPEDL